MANRDYENRFPNSGTLHLRDKRGSQDRGPDMSGNFVLSDDILKYIVDEVRNGARDVHLEMACWSKNSFKDGKRFYSTSFQLPWSERQNQQDGGGSRDRRDDRRDSDRRPTPRNRRDDDDRYARRRDDREEYDERPRRGMDRKTDRQRGMSDEEFSRGDEMPDFLRDDDNDQDPPF